MGVPEPISIHAPLTGCDLRSAHQDSGTSYFNPRTPCGVRPGGGHRIPGLHNFNPRTPCGVRLAAPKQAAPTKTFQSTHPLRGATPVSVTLGLLMRFQSTHPLRGATRGTTTTPYRIAYFNPRTPCGVRPCQVHLPLCPQHISIHAPLTGCDDRGSCNSGSRRYFNPRTPRGVRLH